MQSTPDSEPAPDTRGPRTAAQALRSFLILHALRWLPAGFIVPILVLVPTERGLDLPTVGLVFATYGLTTALLELPTGGLADAIGRSRCCWSRPSPTPACCWRWRSARRRPTSWPARSWVASAALC